MSFCIGNLRLIPLLTANYPSWKQSSKWHLYPLQDFQVIQCLPVLNHKSLLLQLVWLVPLVCFTVYWGSKMQITSGFQSRVKSSWFSLILILIWKPKIEHNPLREKRPAYLVLLSIAMMVKKRPTAFQPPEWIYHLSYCRKSSFKNRGTIPYCLHLLKSTSVSFLTPTLLVVSEASLLVVNNSRLKGSIFTRVLVVSLLSWFGPLILFLCEFNLLLEGLEFPPHCWFWYQIDMVLGLWSGLGSRNGEIVNL